MSSKRKQPKRGQPSKYKKIPDPINPDESKFFVDYEDRGNIPILRLKPEYARQKRKPRSPEKVAAKALLDLLSGKKEPFK